MAYESERAAAVAAVEAACRLCRRVQESLVPADRLLKEDRSPVTVADFGAQAVINSLLERSFHDVPIVAEETARALREEGNEAVREAVAEHVAAVLPGLGAAAAMAAIDRGGYAGGESGRFWTVDPIDGTKGFLRRDQYAVALALVEEGEVVLGVLGCPCLPLSLEEPEGQAGCLFVAVRGEGAFTRALEGGAERAIRVDAVTDPARAVICESVEGAHSSHSDAARIAERLGVAVPSVRMDSQCKYAVLARGEASVYLRLPTRADYREKIWDHAAGALVIREAGGKVTDVTGARLDFTRGRTLEANRGIVATNGALHERVVAAVRETLGARRET
jgi:3'(2'), 5'-bisphosphate nucleotidase